MNPYEILGVPRDADPDTIKKAYRKKAKEQHPDQGGDPDQFKLLAQAYETLNDPDARAHYDQTGETRTANASEAESIALSAVDASLDAPGDLFDNAKKKLRDGIHAIQMMAAGFKDRREKLKDRLQRFQDETPAKQKARPGYRLTEQWFENGIKLNEQKIARAQDETKKLEAAIELLQGLRCSGEKEESDFRPMFVGPFADAPRPGSEANADEARRLFGKM